MVINGVTVKDPNLNGLVETPEPIWSSDTGRSTTGDMIGDLIAVKYTIECTWNIMTYKELYDLRNAILSGMQTAPKGFFNISYPTTDSNGALTTQTRTVYAGNIPARLYSTASNFQRYTDITVTFIEK